MTWKGLAVNKHLPHVLVLPEDDANHQLATGFCLNLNSSVLRRIQVLPVAGGWSQVLKGFLSDHLTYMERYPDRFMVLLIDFDSDGERLAYMKNAIPGHLRERVFVLGTWSQPEDLKRADLGSYEMIGSALARDCQENTSTIWDHNLLRNNAGEVVRLRERIRPILF
jgi:hypothetical protein